MKDTVPAASDQTISEIAQSVGVLGVSLADAAGHIEDVTQEVDRGAGISEDLRADANRILVENQSVIEATSMAHQAANQVEELLRVGNLKVDGILTKVVEVADDVTNAGQEILGLQEAIDRVTQVAQSIVYNRAPNEPSVAERLDRSCKGRGGRAWFYGCRTRGQEPVERNRQRHT